MRKKHPVVFCELFLGPALNAAKLLPVCGFTGGNIDIQLGREEIYLNTSSTGFYIVTQDFSDFVINIST